MQDVEMPVLRPLPIATKSGNILKDWFQWIFKIRKWRLEEDWKFTLATGEEIVIKKGFEFDGASVPRVFWGILSPTGLLLIPGLLHDFGYRYNRLDCMDGTTISEGQGRRYWDRLLLDVALDLNGFKIINRVAWLGVRLGGWTAWNYWRKRGS